MLREIHTSCTSLSWFLVKMEYFRGVYSLECTLWSVFSGVDSLECTLCSGLSGVYSLECTSGVFYPIVWMEEDA